MGPLFSPRASYFRATGLALRARRKPAGRLLRAIIKHASILLFLTPVLLLSSSVLLARTPALAQSEPATFWSLYKWFVIIAVATFLIQAFLIARLLIMQTRRRQAEERFAKSFRANPQPMSLTRIADGLYIDVNDSFLSMSGYTRDEVIGHTSLELRIWEAPEHRANFVQRLNEQGSVVNAETRFRTKDGSLRVLLSSAEKFEVAGEKCLLVASSDITERMAAQQEIGRASCRERV